MKTYSVLFGSALLLGACQTTAPTNKVQDESAKPQEKVVQRNDSGPRPVELLNKPVTSIDDESSFRLWFTYYYKHKSPELVDEAIAFMVAGGYMSEHPDIVAGFLSHVFSQHPDNLKDWLKGWEKYDQRAWSVILLSLWMSSDEKARVLMRLNIDRGETAKVAALREITERDTSPDLLELVARDPRHINILWAAFSATGDERFVEKIISYVEHYEETPVTRRGFLAEAAILSLATNSLQHESVAGVCIDQHETNPSPKIRLLLEAMLSALAQARNVSAGVAH